MRRPPTCPLRPVPFPSHHPLVYLVLLIIYLLACLLACLLLWSRQNTPVSDCSCCRCRCRPLPVGQSSLGSRQLSHPSASAAYDRHSLSPPHALPCGPHLDTASTARPLSSPRPTAMDQWPGYQDAAGASRRYNGSSQTTPTREYPQQQSGLVHPPAGFKYDQYQGSINSHSAQASVASPITVPRDGNGDIPMQDVHDPYGAMKYPMRPHHQSHLSGSGRSANLHSPSEPSAAAQRYSPMEVLSPTSPYGSKVTSNQGQFSTPHSQRQSPNRSEYPPTSPYYGRQGSQLPPIAPYVNSQDNYQSPTVPILDGAYTNDPKSPRRPTHAQTSKAPAEKKPVPQLRKIEGPTELQPRINSQPPFRRANPEGGFISVWPRTPNLSTVTYAKLLSQPLQALTVHLPATYRICNPNFKYESSRNPRRVLTKPSKGTKNDGYDNEDSDYILYVNDILGSEDAGHKCVLRL